MELSITNLGFMRLKKMSSPRAVRRTNNFRGVLQPTCTLLAGEERRHTEVNPASRDLFRPRLAFQVFTAATSQKTFQSKITFRPTILLNYGSHSAIDRRASTFVTTTRPRQIENQHFQLRAKGSGDVRYDQTFLTTTHSRPLRLRAGGSSNVRYEQTFLTLTKSRPSYDGHQRSTPPRHYEVSQYHQLFQLPQLTLRTQQQINRQLTSKVYFNRGDYYFPLPTVDRLFLDVDRKIESLVVARQANAAFHLVRGEMKELLRTDRTEHDNSVLITHRTLGTLALDFAKPKLSQAEEVNKRLVQFISAPAMTYAKTQQAFNESGLAALRDLQTAKPEAKPTPAPQLPSIEQITAQVRTQMERDLRIERQRRGL